MRTGIVAASVFIVVALAAAGPTRADGFRLSSMKAACKCESLRSALTPEDLAEIEKLPAQVIATIAAVKGTPAAPADAKAAAVAKHIGSGSFDGRFDRVKAGTRACTIYFYGFVDLREFVVHRQCAVTREGDAISVSMTTGDGFAARLVPYVPRAEVFIGRTFLTGDANQTYDKATPTSPANAGFGNMVGLALADKGRLTLVSINARGLAGVGPVFFVAIDID